MHDHMIDAQIPVTMIFIGIGLNRIVLRSISFRTLNNNTKFQFGIICHFTSFVVMM